MEEKRVFSTNFTNFKRRIMWVRHEWFCRGAAVVSGLRITQNRAAPVKKGRGTADPGTARQGKWVRRAQSNAERRKERKRKDYTFRGQ